MSNMNYKYQIYAGKLGIEDFYEDKDDISIQIGKISLIWSQL